MCLKYVMMLLYCHMLWSHCTLGRFWIVGYIVDSARSLLTHFHDAYIFIDGFVHCALFYASYVRCNIYILMTLNMYYLVYDVILRSMCTMVLWHIWRPLIYMLYIYYMFSLSVCHAPLVVHKLPCRYIFCK